MEVELTILLLENVINNMIKILFRVFLIVIFIIICNLEIVRFIIFGEGYYNYHSKDGSFRFKTVVYKGRGYQILMADYNSSEAKEMNYPLCRSFRKNPLKFWNWYFYLSDPLCKIPYCSIPKSIINK